MDKKELLQELENLKGQLETAVTQKAKEEIAAQIKALEAKIPDTKALETSVEGIQTSIEEIKQASVKRDEADKKNQEALNTIIADHQEMKKAGGNQPQKKSFGEAFAETVKEHWDEIKQVGKGNKISLDVKAVGTMTLGNTLTGDPVSTQGPLITLPGHRVNLRDLIPTVHSETGQYVQYKETGKEGAPARQTENTDKAEINYDLTEVKTVARYIAGFARFSKQLTKNLPFFQSTLPRLLLRDFYKVENETFFADIVSTDGISGLDSVETNDIMALIDAIAEQNNAGFNPSYALVNYLQLARLNKLLFEGGNAYAGQGGVTSLANGQIAIMGTPIIPAPWVTDDKCLIIDRDYLERIEVESVRVEFFEQDDKNVTKNLITARIECMEEINLMLPQSAKYFDFGNES